MKSSKRKLINQIRNYFSSQRNILSAYLYGSYASGRSTETSDMDIGVLLKEPEKKEVFDREFHFRFDLEKILRMDVDVTILNHADLFLVSEVFIKGEQIYVKDKNRSEELKWYLLKSYWDFIPTKRILEQNALRRLRHFHG